MICEKQLFNKADQINQAAQKKGINVNKLTKEFVPQLSMRNLFLLKKREKRVKALDNISFTVPSGKIIGIFGLNGAGKTTLLKILSGLLLPTSGSVSILGSELSQNSLSIRGRVGLVSTDVRSFFWRLSGYENLRFFAGLNNIFDNKADDVIRQLLDFVELDKKKDVVFMEYSSGMKQRLSIARSLLNDPDILIFDEVGGSLDSKFVNKLFDFLKNSFTAKSGKILLLTSHRADELIEYSDIIVALKQGKLVFCGNDIDEKKLTELAGA